MNLLEPTEHQAQVYKYMGTELLQGMSSSWTNCFSKSKMLTIILNRLNYPVQIKKLTKEGEESAKTAIFAA